MIIVISKDMVSGFYPLPPPPFKGTICYSKGLSLGNVQGGGDVSLNL